MLNRVTRNAYHVLPKSRYRTNVVLVRSNEGRERTTENRVSLYRIFARAKGGGGGGGGAVLNIHEAAWFSRALFAAGMARVNLDLGM